jgi:outer membrane protein assembly factor BamB
MMTFTNTTNYMVRKWGYLSLVVVLFFSCSKSGSEPTPPLSSAKEISSFIITRADNPSLTEDVNGLIAADTIKLFFPPGTTLGSFIPTISLTGVSVSPADKVAQNFSSLVTYTVTAENGTTKRFYVVSNVLAAIPREIISFRFNVANNPFLASDIIGVIGTDSVILTVPYGTPVTGLIPTIQINGTAYSPGGNVPQDYTNPVTYTVWGPHPTPKKYIARVVSVPDNAIVYINAARSSGNGHLYALDAVTGTLKWDYAPASGSLESSMDFSNGVIYTGIADKLTAIDTATRTIKWTYSTGGIIYSTPSVSNGVVYINCDDGYFHAVDAATGVMKWKYQQGSLLGNHNYSSPTVVLGIMYAGSMDGHIYAINATTGNLVWRKENTYAPGSGIQSSPSVVNEVLYIGDNFHHLIAMNVNNGTFKWAFVTNGLVFSSPTVNANVVYAGSSSGMLYAIEINTGGIWWTYNTGASIYGSPVVSKGVVYVGQNTANNAKLFAINASDGALKWTYNNNAVLFSSPVVFNDVVYIGSNAYMLAVDAITGLMKWKFNTLHPQEEILASPCIVDKFGQVFLPGISGNKR